MKGKKLMLTIAAVAIAAPAATAGTDSGIGIPAGRDAVSSAAPVVSEKTAGLFRSARSSVSTASKYGPLDPWAYRVIHQSRTYAQIDPIIANAIRNQSREQTDFSKASASVQTAASGGFDWADAGIGAGVAVAAMLLMLGLAGFALRRSHTRLAGV